MANPYESLPPRAFWRPAVADADRDAYPGLHRPRVALTRATPIATFGSCFAQHVGRALREAGCLVLDGEPRPRMMRDAEARAWGHGLFSARTGNVYTARQMRELLDDAATGHVDPRLVWERDGRWIDALRPGVEPDGLDSPAEALALRDWHLERLAQVLRRAEVMVLTLGLTEAWEDTAAGRVLPLCPGVAGGAFDPARHALARFRHAEVLADLHAVRAASHRFNPAMRMILTVSPVPLTATATDDHVLVATARAKATLRAAAAEFVDEAGDADYFPAWELVTQPGTGPWFEPNLRSVTPEGVARVMGIFLAAHGLAGDAPPTEVPVEAPEEEPDDLACEEALLGAFAPRASA